MPDPTSWTELHELLDYEAQEQHYLDVLPAERRVYCGSLAGCELELIQLESDHRGAIDAAARKYGEMRELAILGLPPIAQKLFWMRINAARELVWGLVRATPNPCVIPYPTVPFPELLGWLLVDWWACGGRDQMVHSLFPHWSVR